MKTNRTYAIIGGTSGIGFALARTLIDRGDHVLIGGRSQERLDHALAALGPAASGTTVDITDRTSLAAFFQQAPILSGIFTPAATYQTGRFSDGDQESREGLFKA